jgi:hypothetical protein
MDVHPTKNVSIGIDPYPCVENDVIYNSESHWLGVVNCWTQGANLAAWDGFTVYTILEEFILYCNYMHFFHSCWEFVVSEGTYITFVILMRVTYFFLFRE